VQEKRYTCLYCTRTFYSKHGRPSRPIKYCSVSCSNRARGKTSRPGQPCEPHRNAIKEHNEEVIKQAKAFRAKGFRYIPLSHCVPDAIAVDFQNQIVLAVEVVHRSNVSPKIIEKYRESRKSLYDDIFFFVYGEKRSYPRVSMRRGHLAETYQKAMRLRAEKGFGYVRIAKALHIPPGSVAHWIYEKVKPWGVS